MKHYWMMIMLSVSASRSQPPARKLHRNEIIKRSLSSMPVLVSQIIHETSSSKNAASIDFRAKAPLCHLATV